VSQPLDHAAQTLMQQAYGQFAEGRFEEAVDTFTAALALAPQEPTALRGRGLARFQLKQWALAAADFDAAKTLAPDDADNWVDLGTSLAMDDRVYPAIAVLEALLTKQPDCIRGHLELGLIHIRVGAIPQGRQHLQAALARRPSLEQRRLIQSILAEQDRLDRKRYYRPDFEALHRQQEAGGSPGLMAAIRQWFGRMRQRRLGRPLAIWCGSVIAIGVLLMPYLQTLWGPLLAAGAVTCAMTVMRVVRKR